MPQKIPLTSLRQISEINLTPLMDLTFILLITFIITFPLIEQGIPVNLPEGDAEPLSVDTARTITIDEQGKVFLDDVSIDLVSLKLLMAEARRHDPSVVVMVRADESVRYGEVVRVLRVLHEAKISKMALVTRGAEDKD